MILLTGPSPARPGGIATYLRHLAAALASTRPELRWEAFVTDKSARGGGLPGRLADGARVAASLRARLAAVRPRLVHICCGSGWGFREAAVHARLATAAGARVLLHLHAARFPEYWDAHPLEHGAIRSVLAGADALGVLSDDFGAYYVGLGARPERVRVIRNGVPLRPLDLPEARPSGPLRLVALGTVGVRKGAPELLEALERLGRVRPGRVEVRWYGPFPEGDEAAAAWRERGRSAGLSFPGAVSPDRVPALLDAADGLVLPSRNEGLPFALLEAMAATRPVLAARSGAIGELLAGGAGELVPAGDPGALAEALIRWADDPEHRLDLAAAGRRRVEQGYTVEHSLRTTIEAWEVALGRSLDAGDAT